MTLQNSHNAVGIRPHADWSPIDKADDYNYNNNNNSNNNIISWRRWTGLLAKSQENYADLLVTCNFVYTTLDTLG